MNKCIVVADGLVACPHCKAPKLCPCTTPKGRLVMPPHKARIELARQQKKVHG